MVLVGKQTGEENEQDLWMISAEPSSNNACEAWVLPLPESDSKTINFKAGDD